MFMAILESLVMSQIQVFCQKKLNGIIIYNKNDDYIKRILYLSIILLHFSQLLVDIMEYMDLYVKHLNLKYFFLIFLNHFFLKHLFNYHYFLYSIHLYSHYHLNLFYQICFIYFFSNFVIIYPFYHILISIIQFYYLIHLHHYLFFNFEFLVFVIFILHLLF